MSGGTDESPASHRSTLRRLQRVWIDDPVFFITVCTEKPEPSLADEAIHTILREVWHTGSEKHGWKVGSYALMPDHVHLFCAPTRIANTTSMSQFIGGWKEWSCKFIRRRLGKNSFAWQRNFFDHVLRSEESYTDKWHYVRMNPVRAGLANHPEDWPFQGHIHFL